MVSDIRFLQILQNISYYICNMKGYEAIITEALFQEMIQDAKTKRIINV